MWPGSTALGKCLLSASEGVRGDSESPVGCPVGEGEGGGGAGREVQGKGLGHTRIGLRARCGHRKLSLPGSHSCPDRGGRVETCLNAQVLKAEAVLQHPLSDSVCL